MGLRAIYMVLLVLLAPAGAMAKPGASEVVAQVNETLLEAMQRADELGYEGRHALLAPVLSKSFDFPRMSQSILRRQWSDLSDAERENFVSAFEAFSIANYASRFDGYDGERWEILREDELRENQVLVRNNLVKSNGETVGINYVLIRERAEDSWRIVDVFLDGKFSEVATRRSEFGSVIGMKGFDALLQLLAEKTKQLASG